MSSIKDIIESPHPVFKNYNDYWKFLLDAYEGGPDYCRAVTTQARNGGLKDYLLKIYAGGRELQSCTSGNLFMHPKERQQDYDERLRMSYYYNFCSPIIDIYTDHLFKQPVIENFGDIESDIEERRENIDNKGGSISELRKEVADLAQIYGHIFVITDSPVYLGDIRSRADLLENGLLPYVTLHHPQNVINWSLDEFGSPYWVVVREVLDSNIDPFNYDKKQAGVVQYRLWTRQEWILYNEGFDEIGRGSHGLGIVPITCIFDKQSKKVRNFLGISAIADIAFIARDVYNSCSELKQILRDQTFAFLAVQGNSSEYDELAVGTSKGLLYPAERNVPQYVSPPTGNAEVYFKHIDRQVAKMFQLAKLEGGSVQAPDQSAVIQSGVSKAWDFNQTNSALSKKAGNLEDGETKLWQVYARWLDKEFDGSVEYPHEFSIQSLNDDLDEAEKIFKLQLGADFNKEIKSTIMKKKFPRMNEQDMQSMIGVMEKQEDTMGKSESSRLVDRIPSLMKIAAANANSGGKQEGFNDKGFAG
jgi:hypothetical protein